MTLSLSHPSASWHRTLPKPSTLLPKLSLDPFSIKSASFQANAVPPSQNSTHDIQLRKLNDTSGTCSSCEEAFSENDVALQASSNHRAAQHGHAEDGNSVIERNGQLRSNSSSPSDVDTSENGNQFCLCQPDPKIPRPRNAFILYRQHHQAAIVAQHPGLPNPDISKIIGEQWRRLSENAKLEWKALAEEEKARHQQQYPDYRYQPRRHHRVGIQQPIPSTSASTPIDDQGNCLKCGGKPMNLPSTPYTVSAINSATSLQSHMTGSRSAHLVSTSPNQKTSQREAMSPPHTSRQPQLLEIYHQPARQTIQYQPSNSHQTGLVPSDGSDLKRRRFDTTGNYVPTREFPSESGYHPAVPGATFIRPNGQVLHTPRTVMAPPPRTAYSGQQARVGVISQLPPKRDSTLVLPPIHTCPSNVAPNSLKTHKSSLEAMIMSIPLVNKIKVLAQISSHLALAGPSSPPYQVRGAIIAVEGLNLTKVYGMVNAVTEQLEREGKFAVRIFAGPDPQATTSNNQSRQLVAIDSFLETIGQWHGISREMIEYITTKPDVNAYSSSAQQMCLSEFSSTPKISTMQENHYKTLRIDSTIKKATHNKVVDQPISPKTVVKPLPNPPIQPRLLSNSREGTSPTDLKLPPLILPRSSPDPETITISSSSLQLQTPCSPQTHLNTDPIPIALVPHYQLTTVDTTSINMPITDAYSPLAHWQWLATLWRGCVGPDLTIVIKGTDTDDPPSASEAERQVPGVELRLQDCRAVLVRLESENSGAVGHNKQQRENETQEMSSKQDEVWEKAKRRVGFEVEEFLRR